MRILLVTQYFYPENFKSNDIAFELSKRGYKVDVLASIPNYPEGMFYKGYGVFQKRKETVDGVHIYRVFNTPRGRKSSKIGLALNYVSYAFNASLWAIWFSVFKKKYDAIIVHQVSPITQAIPAIVLSKLTGAKVYTWVLDVWPEAFVSATHINKPGVVKVFDKITKWVYKGSYKILISSRRFVDSISKKGDFSNKIEYFPNWSVDMSLKGEMEQTPSIPKGFVVMVAGTIGVSQNLDAIVKAAQEFREVDEVKWVFVGDGSKREWLEDYIREHGLEKTMFVLGRFPFSMMPSFYAQADAMLVSLNENYDDLKMVVPARLQSYMSSGKPVLAMIGLGGRELVEEADCGYAVGGNDYMDLVRVIREKVLTDKDGFAKKGINGRKFWNEYFRMDKCIDNLCVIIKQ